MDLLNYVRKQFREEMETTRKFLFIVPMEKADWKPHEKSLELGKLAIHIADLPGWVEMALTTDELDFQNSTYQIPEVKTNKELMDLFDERAKSGIEALTEESTKVFGENWTLRSGDTVYSVSPKIEVVRMAISQIIHHRAQLGVYLRLNEIPIPGSYGPSADDSLGF